MGPVALFDKSFLQSLTLDESVWFDHFFLPVVCPVFFVETLADLTKQRAPGLRSAEEEVRIIADKTPVMSGSPCVLHSQICIANLMGREAPHLGQIPLAGGRPVRSAEGKAGVVFEKSPEAEAFSRWQHAQFHEVERGMASSWREMLADLDLPEVAQRMRALGITPKTCKTVDDAYGIAAALVHSRAEPGQQLGLLFAFVQIPTHLRGPIARRWSDAGFPPLAQYASYAAHVLKVELFFQIALAAGLISTERASNRADIAYLFYLPFCNVFISGDKLHRRCVPPFLSKQQDFVWAADLKAELARVNRTLSDASEEDRQQGLHKLAPRPPGESSNLLVALWEKHAPSSREAEESEISLTPEAESKLVEHLKAFSKAPIAPDVADLPSDDLDSVAIERLVPARKGAWWLIPKKVADAEARRET
jgi:hypothetical protein